MRRSHKKSRYGCKECKRRHTKCDESRPLCNNCRITGRHCSYLDLGAPNLPVTSPSSSAPATAASAVSSPAAPAVHTATTAIRNPLLPQSPATTVASTTTSPASIAAPHYPVSIAAHSPPQPSPQPNGAPKHSQSSSCLSGDGQDLTGNERYSLLHLELLHHFEHVVGRLQGYDHGPWPRKHHIVDLSIQESFKTPFLMDEMLAIAAANKSTEHPIGSPRREFMRQEATRLQTRALAQFNAAQVETTGQESKMAVFLFTAYIGQHVLWETFSSYNGELSVMLDKLTQCIHLNRGIHTTASNVWSELSVYVADMIKEYTTEDEDDELEREQGQTDTPMTSAEDYSNAVSLSIKSSSAECDALLALIEQSSMTEPMRKACSEAVVVLRKVFRNRSRHRNELADARFASRATQDWIIQVSPDYVALLEQRRPEAMAILAYYAVILHRIRNYWVVGDAGSFLIRSITSLLGPYWAKWLEWPNRMLLTEDA